MTQSSCQSGGGNAATVTSLLGTRHKIPERRCSGDEGQKGSLKRGRKREIERKAVENRKTSEGRGMEVLEIGKKNKNKRDRHLVFLGKCKESPRGVPFIALGLHYRLVS